MQFGSSRSFTANCLLYWLLKVKQTSMCYAYHLLRFRDALYYVDGQVHIVTQKQMLGASNCHKTETYRLI